MEALLLTLGLITIFNNDITSFIFILVLTLLAVRFFNKESKSDFVLTISLISLFLVSMWNIYVVLAILVGVAYVMINHFSQVKKKNRYALIQFKEDNLNPRAVRNQWIGTRMEPVSDRYDFDDINIIRFFGTDVIDLTQVIVSGRDNVVICRNCMDRRLSWYQLMFPLNSTYRQSIALSPSLMKMNTTSVMKA